MHIGLGLQMANLDRKVSDADVYRLELGLGAPRRGAGFDSVWVSEHHFSDYQLTSQQSMVLSWLAAQTTDLKLGTMVTVLPWHDPVRVAEKFSRARPPLRRPGDPRPRPWPRAQGVRRVPGRRWASRAAGSPSTARRCSTRSRPASWSTTASCTSSPASRSAPTRSRSFKGRTFASAVSPESMEIMARMGVGLMVIAQKPWETTEAELAAYRERFVELNGAEAPKPVLVVVAGVSKDPAAGRADARASTSSAGPARRSSTTSSTTSGFADIEGYEYYAGLANNIAKHGIDKFNGFLADLQVWGTPDQVTEKLLELRRAHRRRRPRGARSCFGGMPADEAQANYDLFASEVLPELQRHDVGGDIGVTYGRRTAAVA